MTEAMIAKGVADGIFHVMECIAAIIATRWVCEVVFDHFFEIKHPKTPR